LKLALLAPSSPESNPRGLEFLPVKHESVFLQLGSTGLTISLLQASFIVLIVSGLLVIIGIWLLLLSRRSQSFEVLIYNAQPLLPDRARPRGLGC
jgi:hypothetical protein